jgi:hypothetical protein
MLTKNFTSGFTSIVSSDNLSMLMKLFSYLISGQSVGQGVSQFLGGAQ